MKPKHIILIIIGIVLAVGGLVLLIERKEIAFELVGQDRMLHDAFRGGSSFKDAMMSITAGGVIGLILGLSSLIFGFIYGLRSTSK